MGNFHDFANRMRKKAGITEDKFHRAVAELAISVVKEVAPDTPILTGRASSNWITSVGLPSPYYSENPFMNAGPQESIMNARLALQGYKGGTIHIVNNVPYIAELNRGTSRQAPALFVQSAVLRAKYKFKSYKLNL